MLSPESTPRLKRAPGLEIVILKLSPTIDGVLKVAANSAFASTPTPVNIVA